ncbi:hypothetical protein Ciccas_001152 [Cichlidogyrus casuarinus]|uniref:Uncharacterized protein n=1 Tax=Cichlidogyrus casuarinus TaxID=1844966 RepID=A0ABD2QKZ8_9PLAT
MQQAQTGGYMATAPGLNYQSSSSVGNDMYSSHYGSSVSGEMPGRTQEEALNFVRQMLMMNGSGQQQHNSMHLSQAAVQRPSNLGAVGQQPPIGTGSGHHQQHSMMSGSRLAPTNTSNQTVYGSA